MRQKRALTVAGAAVVSLFMITFVPSVAANDPPTITVPDFPDIPQGNVWTYIVAANDPDDDSLRFTWDWGDGGVDVTTTPTATHSYYWKGMFTLTVYADDLTGLPGHNVSDVGLVFVFGWPTPPVIVDWCVDNANPYAGEVIKFTASARDADGDPLRFTFDFGDGTSAVEQGGYTAYDELVTFSVNKSYDTSGLKLARIYVDDGWDSISGTPLAIDVMPNAAPVVWPLPDLLGVVDDVLTFEADAFDPDLTDTLTYTWDFGDETPIAVGNPVTHAYTSADVYVYRVWVADNHGYNVTIAANATIEEARISIDLYAGWNLVSVPLVNHSLKASTLGLSCPDSISRWDPTTQTYDKGYLVGFSGAEDDFDIEPSWSYWIHCYDAKTLEFLGDLPGGTQTRAIVVPEGGGWVQVGLASMQTTLWASDLVDMYPIDMLSSVSRWNADTMTYSDYLVEFGIIDFQLSPGDGMWWYVQASGMLSYNS